MAIKNPFKRKNDIDKNKVVLKKADKEVTEVSVVCVDRSQVSPAPETPKPAKQDLSTLLQQRDAQIASLKNELAGLKDRVVELEQQTKSCTCGAQQKQQVPRSRFSKWS